MKEFRKKVKDKIKMYSNKTYLDGYIKNEFLTEDGTAEIYINIEYKDELFDIWTYGKQIDLEESVYKFLENKTEMLGNSIPIRLHFIGCSFNSSEQEAIKHMLKEHYAIELYKIQKKYEKYRNKIIYFILFGIISLILYAITCHFANPVFFQTVFTFLFTFSLWEAMDAIIYAFSEIRYEREAITQNLLTDIVFDNQDTDNK